MDGKKGTEGGRREGKTEIQRLMPFREALGY